MQKLIKDKAIINDTWQVIENTDVVPQTGDIIITLERWQQERQVLLNREGQLGLRIPNTVDVNTLATDLPHFALIIVEFPKFADGRAYSQARLLRERLNYMGEIRATGEVLRDQILFMSHCGINAYQMRADQDLQQSLQALTEINIIYRNRLQK